MRGFERTLGPLQVAPSTDGMGLMRALQTQGRHGWGGGGDEDLGFSPKWGWRVESQSPTPREDTRSEPASLALELFSDHKEN